jgi:hypothetical protein
MHFSEIIVVSTDHPLSLEVSTASPRAALWVSHSVGVRALHFLFHIGDFVYALSQMMTLVLWIKRFSELWAWLFRLMLLHWTKPDADPNQADLSLRSLCHSFDFHIVFCITNHTRPGNLHDLMYLAVFLVPPPLCRDEAFDFLSSIPRSYVYIYLTLPLTTFFYGTPSSSAN